MAGVKKNQRAFASRGGEVVKLGNANRALSHNNETGGRFLLRASRGLFFLVLILLVCGGSYLYEINSLVTKGYEIREAENKIGELVRDNRQLKIREVELRSMYAIEKSMKDFNLVSPSNVSYVEIDGPVAMIK